MFRIVFSSFYSKCFIKVSRYCYFWVVVFRGLFKVFRLVSGRGFISFFYGSFIFVFEL